MHEQKQRSWVTNLIQKCTSKVIQRKKAWACSSVVKQLSGKYETIGPVPSTGGKKKRGREIQALGRKKQSAGREKPVLLFLSCLDVQAPQLCTLMWSVCILRLWQSLEFWRNSKNRFPNFTLTVRGFNCVCIKKACRDMTISEPLK